MTFRSRVLGTRHRGRLAALLVLAAWSGSSRAARAQDSFGSPSSNQQEPPLPAAQARVVSASNWDATAQVPAGYHIERKVRRSLIVEGAGLFVLAYTFSGVAAASSTQNGALWIPLAGPIVRIAQGFPRASGFVDANGLGTTLLVIDAVVQLAAAGMVVYGVAVPEISLAKDKAGVRLSAIPLAPERGRLGFGIVGRF